jgi:hypothetical protein
MRARYVLVAALAVAACTQQQITQARSDADAAVASAHPAIEMACWLVQAADAGFQAYAASSAVDAGVVDDEKKAIAGANAICAGPPDDLARAIAGLMATYKAVVAATPAVVSKRS